MFRMGSTVAAVVLASLALSSPATAQSSDLEKILREEFRSAAQRSNLGQAFQALAVFNIVPGISAASYYIDDGTAEGGRIDSYKISPSHTFAPIHGIKPYLEGTFGFLDASQTLEANLEAGQPTRSEVDIKTLALLGGAGVEIDLFEGTVLRPILLAGYAHIWDTDSTSGPLAEELVRAGDGIVFNVRTNSLLLGGAVEVEHSGRLDPVTDINYGAKIRYNQLYDKVFSASDPVLEGGGTFGIFTAGASVDGPLWGFSLLDRELRWIGFATNTYLPDSSKDALGFSYFFEVGGGLELVDRSVVGGLEGLSVRSSVLFGNNVYGWTAGLNLEF